MNAPPVASVVRGWVDLYTRGMPEQLRAARRDDVDDDLWCQQEEAAATGRSVRSLGAELFLRLLLGVPADLSWRLSHRGKLAPESDRRQSMSTRVIGALAIAGGASWALSAALVVVLGPSFVDGTNDDAAMGLGIGGAVVFAAAVIGLVWRFQDQTSSAGALAGVLAAMGVLIGPFGAFPLLLLFPIGSVILVWDLARAGILSRAIRMIHAVSAVGMLVPLIAILIDWRAMGIGAFAAAAIPYFLSWVVIGGSLLRGVPQAHDPAASG